MCREGLSCLMSQHADFSLSPAGCIPFAPVLIPPCMCRRRGGEGGWVGTTVDAQAALHRIGEDGAHVDGIAPAAATVPVAVVVCFCLGSTWWVFGGSGLSTPPTPCITSKGADC
ncbi:unnamed protein product [Pylaiella littoralis]